MIRYAFCLILACGVPAMAKDGTYQAPRQMAREPSKQEIFNQSPEGQELDALVDLYMSGDGDKFDQAYEAYRQKYGLTGKPAFPPSGILGQ